MSAFEKAQKSAEVKVSQSKPKIRKVESDEEDSDMKCYEKCDGKPVHDGVYEETSGLQEAAKEIRHLHYYRTDRKKKR